MPQPDEPHAPRVSAPDMRAQLEATTNLPHDALGVHILGLTGDVDLSYATVDESVIEVAAVENLSLRGATLIDVEVRMERATAIDAQDASARRVRISGGRIGALNLSRTTAHELQIDDCRIDYLTFGGATLDDVMIERCDIRTLDVPQAEITRMAFRETVVGELDTNAMRAKHLDLRGLDVDRFLDVASLRGATLTPIQVERIAGALARAAGIAVVP